MPREKNENKHRYKSNTVQVIARQCNHDNYSLPAELTHLSGAPLYFALLQQSPVSRQQICRTFHISTRRAVEVMGYLTDSATPHVTYECLPPIFGVREQGYCVHVYVITGGGVRQKRRAASGIDAEVNSASALVALSDEGVKGHHRVSCKANEQAYQKSHNWFLLLPNPNAQPEEQNKL